MNRRKILYLCALGVAVPTLLTGCGDGSEEAELVQQALVVESEPLLSETERAICDYELKYNTGTFQMQDYHALADLYQESGMIRKQRDILEQSYRLFEDAEALAKLEDIAVNLAEEEEAVQQEAETMLQNLDLPEYLDESVNLISSSRWMRTMMPKLSEGKRKYFLQKGDRTALVIEVGYDENRKPYSDVWYVNEENQMTLLQYSGETVQMLQAALNNGVYDGAFERWLVDGNNGIIRHEQGTFTEGVYTGAYTASIHPGTGGSDLFSLWSNRDTMAYTTYTGQFDEQGRTTLEQPTAENQAALIAGSDNAGCVVYAYDEGGLNCLFLGLKEGTAPGEYRFDSTAMGVKAYPAFEVYTPVTEDIDNSNTEMQIRIFDGELQYYNGYKWVGVGKAQDYVKDDPFYVYAEQKEELDNKLWGATTGSPAGAVEDGGENAENGDGTSSNSGSADNQGMGVIATPSPTPAPAKKPAVTKPAVTQPPAAVQTPAPTAPPALAPDDDDDDGDDNNTSAPAPDPAPKPPADGGSDSGNTGGDSGGSGDSGGGDTDIEWSPDIM